MSTSHVVKCCALFSYLIVFAVQDKYAPRGELAQGCSSFVTLQHSAVWTGITHLPRCLQLPVRLFTSVHLVGSLPSPPVLYLVLQAEHP